VVAAISPDFVGEAAFVVDSWICWMAFVVKNAVSVAVTNKARSAVASFVQIVPFTFTVVAVGSVGCCNGWVALAAVLFPASISTFVPFFILWTFTIVVDLTFLIGYADVGVVA